MMDARAVGGHVRTRLAKATVGKTPTCAPANLNSLLTAHARTANLEAEVRRRRVRLASSPH